MVPRRITPRPLSSLCVALLLLIGSAPAPGQISPGDFENLTVLPPETDDRELIALMKSYTRALGVRCEYCHVGAPGASMAEIDFVSDEKPAKETTRLMIRMTRDINQRYLEGLGEGALQVSCLTCHRGQARPQTLEQVLAETLTAKGLEETLATYRRLHTENQGSGSFDFRAKSVDRLARNLIGEKQLDAARALLELNLEYHPEEANTHFLLGEVLLKQGDHSKAAASYRQALKFDPENVSAQLRLEELSKEGT